MTFTYSTRLATLLVLSLVVLVSAAPARADFGIASFDGAVTNPDGTAATQAGSHPFAASTAFTLNTHTDLAGAFRLDANLRNLEVRLPAGLIGNPGAVPTCTNTELEADAQFGGCPPSTQVGLADAGIAYVGFDFPIETLPVFNMKPPPGVAAQFAFNVVGQVVRLTPKIRTGGDYGVSVETRDAGQGVSIYKTKVTFWGVPSDPSHDAVRACRPAPSPCASVAPRRPFLSLPTSCAGPQTTTMGAESWQQPGDIKTASFVSHDEHGDPVGVTGCDQVPFDPTLTLRPTSNSTGAPTGLAVDLTIPQNDNPTGLSQAHLKKAVVTLPPGMTVNAASADGLGACSTAQADLDSPDPATCPSSSNIGDVQIDTPLVDHPLKGGVYLAQPNANPFGSLLAMYIAVNDAETGTVIKLPGLIEADPVTGQLKATIDDNPQLPFERFHMEFKTGPRASLSNPRTCGTFTTHAELTSWASSTPVSSDSPTVISDGCDRAAKFEPTFSAGTTSPTAGATSSFVMDFGRPSAQQTLGTITTALPVGLLGAVGRVPLCPEPQAATGACAPASQLGTVQVASGTGAAPVWLPQPGRLPTAVYLAGPYKGAPYSLSVVVPAQAGPFDLGTVVVRAALFVDPVDAHVTAKADPLPTILQGIPLEVQKARITLDRPGFMVNPTSCAEKRIAAVITSTQGASVGVGSRFQVGDCGSLGLSPKLGLALTGRKQLTDGRHPGVRAVLRQKSGQANLDRVAVKLPLSLALDPDNADGLCAYAESIKPDPKCPASSIVGSARAVTPLLSKALSGPVYFAKNVRKDAKTGREIRTLPALVIALRGEVALNLRGDSSVKGGRLVNTFATVPDAAVSRFELNLKGGGKGILVVNGKACKRSRAATVAIDGHNGKALDQTVTIKAPCAKASGKRDHTSKRSRHTQRR